MTKKKNVRSALLAGASTALIAGFGASTAFADPAVNTTAAQSISVEQQFNDFTGVPVVTTLSGNSDSNLEVEIYSDDPAIYALRNSTVTVGSGINNGNSTSATGYANSADLTVNVDLNNVTGSSNAVQIAEADIDNGASASSNADIAISLAQQNIATAATVADEATLLIDLIGGTDGSTATIAGNTHSATGVLNAGTNAMAANVNNSNGSLGIASSQSSLNSALTANETTYAAFYANAGASGIAVNDSTVSIADNRQTATAVANSVNNSQTVAGNELALDLSATGSAFANGAFDTRSSGAYATASRQQLAADVGETAAVNATVIVDNDDGGYIAYIDGDVSGSTLSLANNALRAVARGNEGVSTTTVEANALTSVDSTGVAAISALQDVVGNVTISAGVGGSGNILPAVEVAISGDVRDSSRVVNSNNIVVADAAANRGSNAISATATTINTAGVEPGQAYVTGSYGQAWGALAVASQQSVSAGVTIVAGLSDSMVHPTSGTSISTEISDSVLDSSVASNGNQLTAMAAGNATMSGGNAIALSGTNVATTAAVANQQTMEGDIAAVIGAAGAAPVPPGTQNFLFVGSSSDDGDGSYTFTGTAAGTQEDRDALALRYPALTFTYNAGVITLVAPDQVTPVTEVARNYNSAGSAGYPASGGVTVVVGNDIFDSSVVVQSNTVTGSAVGNNAANRIVADATNLSNGGPVATASAGTSVPAIESNADISVASHQLVSDSADLSSTVGSVFSVTAEGVDSPLSNVDNSTISVAGNAAQSTVTGNIANNSASVSGTNVSNSSALTNAQGMEGDLTATVSDFSGAFAVIGRDVTDSSVLVDGNAFAGSTTGNLATNKVAAKGSSSLAQGDVTVGALADPSTSASTDVVAQADHALANIQVLTDGTLVTSVEANYAIQLLGLGAPTGVDDTSDVAASTLSVSNNAQSASSIGNSASNAVDLSGGAIATDGALMSVQAATDTIVAAGSTMGVAAPAAITSSSLEMNGNSNNATATVNTATNALKVDAATDLVSNVSGAMLAGDPASDYSVTATFAVNNKQLVSGGEVDAYATTVVTNNDGNWTTPLNSDGIQRSSITANGNSTTAAATSNNAVNALALSANSNSASAGVLNQQSSSASVSANADAYVGFTVAGYDAAITDVTPVANSAVSVAGNSTVARAGGNNSTNSLSATATSFENETFGGFVDLNADRDDVVVATFGVLNQQVNTGPINATANVTYGAAIDTLGAADTVLNSAVAVTANRVASVAYGNATVNSVTFAALNTPTTQNADVLTTAIASNQLNTGNVTASTEARDVSIYVNSNSGAGAGAVANSSLSITGNAVSASAYGNSATSTLTITGNNVNVTSPIL